MISAPDRLTLRERLLADFSLMLGDQPEDARFLASMYDDVLADFIGRRVMPAPDELGGKVMMRLARDGRHDMLQMVGTLHGRDAAAMPIAEYLAVHAVGHVHSIAPAAVPHVAPDQVQATRRVETVLSAVRASVSRDGMAETMREQAARIETRMPGIKAAAGSAWDAVLNRIDRHIGSISEVADRIAAPVARKIEAFSTWSDDVSAVSRARFATFGKAVSDTAKDFIGGIGRLFGRGRNLAMDAPDRIRAVARDTVDALGDRRWALQNTAEQAKEDLRSHVQGFVTGLADRRDEVMTSLSEKRYAVEGATILAREGVRSAIDRVRLGLSEKLHGMAAVISPSTEAAATAALAGRMEPTFGTTQPMDTPAPVAVDQATKIDSQERTSLSDVPPPELEEAVKLRFAFMEDAVLQRAEFALSAACEAWNNYVDLLPDRGRKMLMSEFIREAMLYSEWYSWQSGYDFMDTFAKSDDEVDLYDAVYAHRQATDPDTLALLTGGTHDAAIEAEMSDDEAAMIREYGDQSAKEPSLEAIFHPVGLEVPDTFRDKLALKKSEMVAQRESFTLSP